MDKGEIVACPYCRYDLRGGIAPNQPFRVRCPECGRTVDRDVIANRRRGRRLCVAAVYALATLPGPSLAAAFMLLFQSEYAPDWGFMPAFVVAQFIAVVTGGVVSWRVMGVRAAVCLVLPIVVTLFCTLASAAGLFLFLLAHAPRC